MSTVWEEEALTENGIEDKEYGNMVPLNLILSPTASPKVELPSMVKKKAGEAAPVGNRVRVDTQGNIIK